MWPFKKKKKKKLTVEKVGEFLINRHIDHFAPWETYELRYPETEYYGRDIGTWKITIKRLEEK